MIFIFSAHSSDIAEKVCFDVPENIKNSCTLNSGDFCVIRHFDDFYSVYVTKIVKNKVTNQYEVDPDVIMCKALENTSK